MAEEKEPLFPMNVEQCPNCGSEKRLANEVIKGEKVKGKAGQNIKAFIFRQQSLIMDLSRTVLSAPMIITFFDVCADCGTVYCVRAELKDAVPGTPPKQPPTFDPNRNN